ncbi:hypothetical protein BCV70DRAFT_196692 [Testicularia cyperi]|uniref:WD repeat-containing protein 75 second beta-propeller domain-containing protein n=1 Tax=Testicularia cyperi TaxID=1882483 RepID=A0A317XWZ3_9BASI|nr:hypothetical protein BCV70DRAFT_196692 [Testicularia cyperi]
MTPAVSQASPAKLARQPNGVAKSGSPKKLPARSNGIHGAVSQQQSTAITVTKSSRRKKKDKRVHPESAALAPAVSALSVQTIGEGRMSSLPVVFTRDADYFFCVSKTSIRIYSRTTGQVVSTLSTGRGAHFAPITAIMINPANPLQLLTASLDGHVKVWDFLDGVLLRSFDLRFPITGMAAHASLPNFVFLALKKPRHRDLDNAPKSIHHILRSLDNGGTFNSIIGSINLDPASAVQDAASSSVAAGNPARPNFARGASIQPKLMRIGKTREAVAISISPNGKWLVVVGSDKVQVAKTSDLGSGFTKFIASHPGAKRAEQYAMTCMAFHPTDATRLVTGDSSGRIRVWYCLHDKFMSPSHADADEGMERHAPSTVMHWHAHAVSSLAFSPNGVNLLSGGEEGVLVVWHLGSSGAGAGAQKEFVPRLGAPIASIAVANGLDGREQEYAVALADGTVTFVSSMSLKPTRSFTRIKIDASRQIEAVPTTTSTSGTGAPAQARVPLAVHPTTGALVLLAGHPSSIQFYDPIKDATSAELEVAPSNRVSRADEEPIEPTRVEQVAFSPSVSSRTGERGEWMVTFDSRNLTDASSSAANGAGSVDITSESSLKFWRWDPNNRRYALNTRIDRPHHGKRITSITFSPVTYLLVTTALDGKARSWHLASRTLKSGKLESYWACRSVFVYRDQTPTCSAFSADGSILAVGQQGSVTLWSPESNLMTGTVTSPELDRGVTTVSFSGRYLGVGTPSAVVIWDLVLSRLVKRKELEAGQSCRLLLSSAARQDRFCVVSSTGRAVTNKPRTTIEELPLVSASATSSAKAEAKSERGVYFAAVDAIVPLVPAASVAASEAGDLRDFVAVNRDMDIVLISLKGSASSAVASTGSAAAAAANIRGISNVRRSLFDDLFGPSTFEDNVDDDTEHPGRARLAAQTSTSGTGVASLFATAAHLLPPASSLLEAFISKILPPAPARAVNAGGARPGNTATTSTRSRSTGEKAHALVAEKQNGIHTHQSALNEKSVQDILLDDTEELVAMFRDHALTETRPNTTVTAAKRLAKAAGAASVPTVNMSTPLRKSHLNGLAKSSTPRGTPKTSTPSANANATATSTPSSQSPSKSSRKRKA